MSWDRRKKIIFQSVIVAFVLTFTWIGVLVALQMLKDSTYRFQDETTAVLEQIRDGNKSSTELYYDSSPRFRDTMVRTRFLELTSRVNQTLGEFKEVLATYDPAVTEGPQGKTGHVTVSLLFENGKTRGSFSFHFYDGKWRLLGLSIDIPEDLDDESFKPLYEFNKARNEASGEIIDIMNTTLELVRAGDGAKIYDGSGERFKGAITRERFLERLTLQKELLGEFTRILHITHSWESGTKNRASVTCVLEFEKGKIKSKAEAWFEFERTMADGPWELFKFIIKMPEPVVPRRPKKPGK